MRRRCHHVISRSEFSCWIRQCYWSDGPIAVASAANSDAFVRPSERLGLSVQTLGDFYGLYCFSKLMVSVRRSAVPLSAWYSDS